VWLNTFTWTWDESSQVKSSHSVVCLLCGEASISVTVGRLSFREAVVKPDTELYCSLSYPLDSHQRRRLRSHSRSSDVSEEKRHRFGGLRHCSEFFKI